MNQQKEISEIRIGLGALIVSIGPLYLSLFLHELQTLLPVVAFFALWLTFTGFFTDKLSERLKLLALPMLWALVIYASTITEHTDGSFGWLYTFLLIFLLSIVWLAETLRARAAKFHYEYSNRFFFLAECSLAFSALLSCAGENAPKTLFSLSLLGGLAIFAFSILCFLVELGWSKADAGKSFFDEVELKSSSL